MELAFGLLWPPKLPRPQGIFSSISEVIGSMSEGVVIVPRLCDNMSRVRHLARPRRQTHRDHLND